MRGQMATGRQRMASGCAYQPLHVSSAGGAQKPYSRYGSGSRLTRAYELTKHSARIPPMAPQESNTALSNRCLLTLAHWIAPTRSYQSRPCLRWEYLANLFSKVVQVGCAIRNIMEPASRRHLLSVSPPISEN